MEIFHRKKDFEVFRKHLNPIENVGFIPTMGALHEGHLSLFKKSVENNDITIGSIFVNPTQFDNNEDFAKYPITFTEDCKMLASIGVDAVFAPTVEDMYPEGLEVEKFDLHGMDTIMEGKYRPGHFEGMVTIVKRLFEIVQPHRAYFGEKDYQQLQIIRTMTAEYMPKIEIIGMPIIREPNGLALSSRNRRLTVQQQQDATVIYNSLREMKDLSSQLPPKMLYEIAYKNFAFSYLQLEYCTIADANTLQEASSFEKDKSYRAFIAAYSRDVRLIDNIELL